MCYIRFNVTKNLKNFTKYLKKQDVWFAFTLPYSSIYRRFSSLMKISPHSPRSSPREATSALRDRVSLRLPYASFPPHLSPVEMSNRPCWVGLTSFRAADCRAAQA